MSRRALAGIASLSATVITVLAITGMAVAGHPTATAAPPGPPRYYAGIEGFRSNVVTIRATSTGKITDTYVYAAEGSIGAIAAAPDDRTFYFVEDAFSRLTATVKTFRITASGKITGLATVHGGTISTHGGGVNSLAVSPDASSLAAGEFLNPGPASGGDHVADLIVIDQRTGKQTVWQGIRHKNWPVSIPSISWTPDGRSVVYLLQWCQSGGGNLCNPPGSQYAEVWSLDASSRGGALASHGHRLLAQSAGFPYVIQQALASSHNGAVLVMVVWGHGHTNLAVDQVSVPAGKITSVLYHTVLGELPVSSLSADGSRTYLLIDGYAAHHGWVIREGHLHPLLPSNVDGSEMVW